VSGNVFIGHAEKPDTVRNPDVLTAKLRELFKAVAP
jgi:hypothetical protein